LYFGENRLSGHTQKTVEREALTSGVGLFTGEKVSLRLKPAPPDSGIVFQRVDLPGKPVIPALLSSVQEFPRCTRLSKGGADIYMVEHLLSAIRAMEVDNLVIEVEGPEIVSGDGSASLFIDLLEEAKVVDQGVSARVLKIDRPVFWSQGDVHLVALPAEEFQLSYTLHYPKSPLVGSQYYCLALSPERFKNEIASCRTFSFYEEILPFIEKGIIKGGGLENALVIKGDQVMNPGGARFPDEMVRHKILDLNGDLALIGTRVIGHIIAVRSGHSSNVAFARLIANLENCS
jgi:UDP-3-O-[3-hydroxymyristoyl] N-acetylglucosamine deacetylase